MTREERLELLKQIEKDIHVNSLESTLLEDAKSCAIHSVIEELEQEHSDKQRYVVRGINNDKIEFIDKYSVRAFNRYIKFIKDSCKYEFFDSIRNELIQAIQNGVIKIESGNEELFRIIDKYKESEAT